MNGDIANLIIHIQSLKQEFLKRHKPELIDGTQMTNVSQTIVEDQPEQSKEFEHLMRQQRRLVYKKDIVAQAKAETAMNDMLKLQKDNDIKQKLSSLANYHHKDETNHLLELQKPWNKLSNNLRIEATLKFIETIKQYISVDQSNQLRYLLISAVSQKHLNKNTDVDYDIEAGKITKIRRLIIKNDVFELSNLDEGEKSIGLDTYIKSPSPSPSQTKILQKKILCINKKAKVICTPPVVLPSPPVVLPSPPVVPILNTPTPQIKIKKITLTKNVAKIIE
jgi:hypothetical protein